MSATDAPTYEFAELIVGHLNDPDGFTAFKQVRSLIGDDTTTGYGGGPLEALNEMGALGWQVVSERELEEGRLMWVWAALGRANAKGPSSWSGRVFLLTRLVRD